ncbi:Paf1-domain-containing protein [Armillaria borealis]|uniref:Paf1-domain-containing protein n=1 Tax=Armillaria borealis TaxID=47425 RepID=A0AA39MUU3_9AGAR|nr:Paf1-domain-containing protein [Armillaria borealis]
MQECGMPLDLSKWESLWEENGDDSGARIETEVAGPSSGPYTNGHATPNGPGIPSTPLAHVPWLRKTEYTSRTDNTARGWTHRVVPPIDVSHSAQLRDIEASFACCNEGFSLEALRHPTKPDVTAVESYEVLPDVEIWSNQYDLFRFSERPGERPIDVEDPRLDCAILRPMKTEHDSFLAYYLTDDDESALDFKESRSKLQPYEVAPNQPETVFRFVRDYETVKVEQEVPNEFLIVLEDGVEDLKPSIDGSDTKPRRNAKTRGAYYKNIERKMTLKKKRQNAFEQYEDKWDLIRMSHTDMSKEEEDERQEALAEVVDPMFLMRGDADADGEGEVDHETVALSNAPSDFPLPMEI